MWPIFLSDVRPHTKHIILEASHVLVLQVSQKIAVHFNSVLESKDADDVKKIVEKVDAAGPYVNFFFRMGYLVSFYV